MRIHSGEKHSAERPFLCKQCTNSFSQASKLKELWRETIYLKPFAGNQCTKLFTQAGYLKVHMRTHTGFKITDQSV